MNAIEIRNMYKDFKLVYDKPTTLKERICFLENNKGSKKTSFEEYQFTI